VPPHAVTTTDDRAVAAARARTAAARTSDVPTATGRPLTSSSELAEPVRRVRRSGGSGYLPGLDGLRAIAVAAVVAYHLGYLPGGFVGVELFFVLSGWLITTLLLRDTPGSWPALATWWRRRLTRLTPAVAVVVAATLVVFGASNAVAVDGVATLTWWQNWRLVLEGTSYWSGTASPLRHAWSLAIEEQFYLVWPAVLVGVTWVSGRSGLGRRTCIGACALVGASASFAWAAWAAASVGDLSRIYFGTDTRVGALLLGCAVAAAGPAAGRAVASRRSTLAACAAAVVLVVACVVLDPSQRITYSGALLACAIASVLLILAAASPGPVQRALSVPVLRWVGQRSYGLYLWSWPVQLLVEREWPDGPRGVRSVVVVVVAVALAAASHRLVEQPLRRPTGTWAEPRQRRRIAWLAGGAALVVAVAYAAVVAPVPTTPQVDTEDSLRLALAEPAPPPTAATGADGSGTVPLEPAAPGPAPLPPAGVRAMIMGDSQAFMAAWLLSRDELPARIESLDTRAILGCGVLSHWGWRHVDPLLSNTAECESGPRSVELGLEGRPDLVIWPIGGWEHLPWERGGERLEPLSAELSAELYAAIVERGTQIAATGARLALVQWVCPGPATGSNVDPGDAARRTPEYARFVNAVIDRAAAVVPGAVVVRANEQMCVGGDPTGAPTAAKADAMSDGIHVDDDGQRWWWEWLAGQLPAA